MARVDVYRAWPEGYQAMQAMEAAVRGSGLEHSLLELVKTRVSQINQCAFCIDMHSSLRRGMLRPPSPIPQGCAHRACGAFGARNPARTCGRRRRTYAVVAINSWNRLAITAAGRVGSYVAGSR